MQRAVMARIGLLSDKLYMIVASQQVMPLDKPIGRPDMQHWKGVLVRCLPLASSLAVAAQGNPQTFSDSTAISVPCSIAVRGQNTKLSADSKSDCSKARLQTFLSRTSEGVDVWCAGYGESVYVPEGGGPGGQA